MSLLNPGRHMVRAIAAIMPKPTPPPTRTPIYDGKIVLGAAGVGVLILPGATPRAMRDVAAMLCDAANDKERGRA
jgi:hypothetical protein